MRSGVFHLEISQIIAGLAGSESTAEPRMLFDYVPGLLPRSSARSKRPLLGFSLKYEHVKDGLGAVPLRGLTLPGHEHDHSHCTNDHRRKTLCNKAVLEPADAHGEAGN